MYFHHFSAIKNRVFYLIILRFFTQTIMSLAWTYNWYGTEQSSFLRFVTRIFAWISTLPSRCSHLTCWWSYAVITFGSKGHAPFRAISKKKLNHKNIFHPSFFCILAENSGIAKTTHPISKLYVGNLLLMLLVTLFLMILPRKKKNKKLITYSKIYILNVRESEDISGKRWCWRGLCYEILSLRMSSRFKGY